MRVREIDGDGARGNESETEREGIEWEWERDWEWEGMRETVSFLSERTVSFLRDMFWKFDWSAGHVVEKKSSPMDSISMYKNQVQWTWFIYKKTKFTKLDFCK